MLLNLGSLYYFSRGYSSDCGFGMDLGRIWYCISNMSEKEINTTDPLDDALAIQAIDAGRRLIEVAPTKSVTLDEELRTIAPSNTNKNKLIAFGAGVAAVAAIGGFSTIASAGQQVPTFSEETTTYPVELNDGPYDIAESIPGIDTIDIRDAVDHITVDPANTEVFKDGLQPGEQVVVPVSINGAEASDQ